LQEIASDPFVQQLTQQFRDGTRTLAQLESALMENYFWQYRLDSWSTLGLQKINRQTGQPVALSDYQSELLNSRD
jgi:hypothetical protein